MTIHRYGMLFVLMLWSSIVARLFWRVVIVTVASLGLLRFRFIQYSNFLNWILDGFPPTSVTLVSLWGWLGNDISLTDDAARILYDTILYYADDDDERIDVKRLKTWPFGAALLSRRVIVRCGTLQADQCMVGWMSSFSLQVRCWQIIVHWWW